MKSSSEWPLAAEAQRERPSATCQGRWENRQHILINVKKKFKVSTLWQKVMTHFPSPSKAAGEALELKVLNKRKRLDALKHATRTQQLRLEELQLEYQRVKKAAGARAKHCDARTRKKEEDAMVVLIIQRCASIVYNIQHCHWFGCSDVCDHRKCAPWKTAWRRCTSSATRPRTSSLTIRNSEVTCR